MMKNKTVFISRSVFSNSPLCQSNSYKLVAQSLIQFKSIEIIEFPAADWYFFYSRNGVYFSLMQMNDRSLLQAMKIGTMGGGTALQFQNMTGRTPDFIGSGDAEDVATNFDLQAHGKSVVFIRAKHSLQSIQKSLKDKVTPLELISYENSWKENIDIPITDIAIFTSPMNVDAYFNAIKDLNIQDTVLIALGRSTKKAIEKYSSNKILIPEEPSEKGVKDLIDILL